MAESENDEVEKPKTGYHRKMFRLVNNPNGPGLVRKDDLPADAPKAEKTQDACLLTETR